MLPATADVERNFLLDDGAALDAFLHDGGAVLTGHHVETRPEENSGRVVCADETVAQYCSVVNILLAEQTFLHSRGAAGADRDVTAGREENLSSLVRTDETLVQQFLVSDAHHPVTSDDPLHRLARVGCAHRALL